MKYFPRGCCDDACDLFAYYLFNEFGIKTVQLNGFIESEDTYHNWLVAEDDIIIDLTIKQFNYFNNYEDMFYFGYSNEFYLNIDRIKQVSHCDITAHKNLNLEYGLILKNIAINT